MVSLGIQSNNLSTLHFSLIQSKLYWEDKEANLDMFARKILQMDVPTEIIVLPEMFSTGFTMQPQQFAETMEGTTVDWMRRLSHEKRAIITGSIVIEEEGQYFNRLIWMLPNGQLGYYDKRHLFAFAGEDTDEVLTSPSSSSSSSSSSPSSPSLLRSSPSLSRISRSGRSRSRK